MIRGAPVIALVTAMLVSPCVGLVHADGFVDFRNDRSFRTSADRLVRDISGAPLVGTNYVAQLYYGPQDADPSSLDPVPYAPAPFRPLTDTQPGTWAGGDRMLFGFFPGDTVTLQVRVWDGNLAASYEEAATLGFLGTQHGVSDPFPFTIPAVGPPPFAWYIENFRGFTLVPEPSVALLGIVGIAGLCFWRGRERSP
jgi:hypothetical protein